MAKQGRLLLSWGFDEAEELDPDMLWEDMIDYLGSILDKKNKGIHWKCTVNNFGWRSLNGEAYIEAQEGREFLRKILPETDCHFKIFNFGKGLLIQNWHHDAPTGAEKYVCMPIASSTYFEHNQ
jgi:hypothetical protein